jgi:hypothetical protein
MVNRVLGPRVPGSEHIPFSPMNLPGGEMLTGKVRNADGKLIDWKSPLRERHYQVVVEDRNLGCIPVFPKAGMALADQFCSTLKLAIKSGRISGWSNPHVVPADVQVIPKI